MIVPSLQQYSNCALITCLPYFISGFLLSTIILLIINVYLYQRLNQIVQKYYPEPRCDETRTSN